MSLGAPRPGGSLTSQLRHALSPPLTSAFFGRPGLGFLARRLPPPLVGPLCLALLLGVSPRLLGEPLAAAPFRTLRLAAFPARLGRVHRRSSRAAAVVAASVA